MNARVDDFDTDIENGVTYHLGLLSQIKFTHENTADLSNRMFPGWTLVLDKVTSKEPIRSLGFQFLLDVPGRDEPVIVLSGKVENTKNFNLHMVFDGIYDETTGRLKKFCLGVKGGPQSNSELSEVNERKLVNLLSVAKGMIGERLDSDFDKAQEAQREIIEEREYQKSKFNSGLENILRNIPTDFSEEMESKAPRI